MANISYELVLSVFGCSTVALATPEGPVLARNMDWWPEEALARASYAIDVKKNGRERYVHAGFPGLIGALTGYSHRGFGLALNAVMSDEGIRRTGYPVLLHLRRVLEDARDFAHALKMLSRQTLACSALVTLVGTRNDERVVVERTPTRHALRWPDRGRALVATNDYRKLFRPETREGLEIYETTCARYEALTEFFAGSEGTSDVADEALLYVLSDPRVEQSITAQHVIVRPSRRQLRLFVPRRLWAK